jgi:hypothetical protein
MPVLLTLKDEREGVFWAEDSICGYGGGGVQRAPMEQGHHVNNVELNHLGTCHLIRGIQNYSSRNLVTEQKRIPEQNWARKL